MTDSTHKSQAGQPALTQIPAEVACAYDYELLAAHFLDTAHHAYIAGGSGHDTTLAANHSAFARYALYPRILCDVTGGHTRLRLLDQPLTHPILFAPVAYQQLAHPEGELETARAAAATDTTMICSTLSSIRLEDIASQAGARHWFQLYFQPDREATLDLLQRAEAAGYAAIMVTLDTAIQVPGIRSRRAGFVMPSHCQPVNLRDHMQPEQVQLTPGQSLIFQGYMSEAPTWDDLAWLQQQTSLPILVKGVLHPDDACQLQAMGINGIVVSNHGGRALDGAPSSLCVLPAIRAALGKDFPILFDSGIRSGSDIFKALALGANAVMIGRLQMYALSVAGGLGVAHMLRLLREELEACMALTGCATIADIQPSTLLDME